MNWLRLNVTTEGHTEELFARRVIAPHLARFRVNVQVRRVLTNRVLRVRGGMTTYARAKGDLIRWMRHENQGDVRFTTMFDLYGLPSDFPGKPEAETLSDPYAKVELIQRSMSEDIADLRFIPYIQLHEFEALVLADPDQLAEEYFDREEQIAQLKQVIAAHMNNPELVDDGVESAPSKRIRQLIPGYDKVNVGSMLVELSGLDVVRKRCRHFDEWLDVLESLGSQQS